MTTATPSLSLAPSRLADLRERMTQVLRSPITRFDLEAEVDPGVADSIALHHSFDARRVRLQVYRVGAVAPRVVLYATAKVAMAPERLINRALRLYRALAGLAEGTRVEGEMLADGMVVMRVGLVCEKGSN